MRGIISFTHLGDLTGHQVSRVDQPTEPAPPSPRHGRRRAPHPGRSPDQGQRGQSTVEERPRPARRRPAARPAGRIGCTARRRRRADVRRAGGKDASPAQGPSQRGERLHSAMRYKRLERGTFHLPTEPRAGHRHVELDAGDLHLMLEGVDLRGARRRDRWRRLPHEQGAGVPAQ